MEKQDQILMKKQNKKLVLDILKHQAPISRMEISKITGMSPTSITRIVNELHQEGFICETELVTSGVGRKAKLLDVCKDVLYMIGIEIDRTIFRIGLVNFMGDIVELNTFARHESETYEDTVETVQQHVKQIVKKNGISEQKIIGLAVGLPGIVDHEQGTVRLSDQLRWQDAPLAADLKRKTGFNVIIDNELKMKAIAESFIGQAKGAKNAVLVGIGSGIGAAIILNGEIFRGEGNHAGEIGHAVVDPTGNVCNCGNIGCLATYISEGALLADSRKVKDVDSIDDVFEAFRNHEQWALNIFDRTTTYIAMAISNILSLYSPEVIILSGNLIEKVPEIMDIIDRKCQAYIWGPIKQTVRIVYSQISERGVVLGAAIQAQKQLFDIE